MEHSATGLLVRRDAGAHVRRSTRRKAHAHAAGTALDSKHAVPSHRVHRAGAGGAHGEVKRGRVAAVTRPEPVVAAEPACLRTYGERAASLEPARGRPSSVTSIGSTHSEQAVLAYDLAKDEEVPSFAPVATPAHGKALQLGSETFTLPHDQAGDAVRLATGVAVVAAAKAARAARKPRYHDPTTHPGFDPEDSLSCSGDCGHPYCESCMAFAYAKHQERKQSRRSVSKRS